MSQCEMDKQIMILKNHDWYILFQFWCGTMYQDTKRMILNISQNFLPILINVKYKVNHKWINKWVYLLINAMSTSFPIFQ